MSYLEWGTHYSVQDTFIDSQHKNIIKAINALIDAIDEGKAGSFCLKLHAALKAYAERHFSHEEEILEKLQYSDLRRHRKQHQFYVQKIEEMEKKFKADEPDIERELEMLDFLKEWFYNHILKSDFRYIDLLQGSQNRI